MNNLNNNDNALSLDVVNSNDQNQSKSAKKQDRSNVILKLAASIFAALTVADIGVFLSSPFLAATAYIIAGITLSTRAVVVGSYFAAAAAISLVALPVLAVTALTLGFLSKPYTPYFGRC